MKKINKGVGSGGRGERCDDGGKKRWGAKKQGRGTY